MSLHQSGSVPLLTLLTPANCKPPTSATSVLTQTALWCSFARTARRCDRQDHANEHHGSRGWACGGAVEEYLSYWLKNVVQVERRPKTYPGYESAVHRHLIPELGKKRLGKLTARDVRLSFTRIREACQC